MADVSPTYWRKSSYSDTGNDTCIEVASELHSIFVRDSKDPDGPRLTFAAEEWKTFTQRIASGEAEIR